MSLIGRLFMILLGFLAASLVAGAIVVGAVLFPALSDFADGPIDPSALNVVLGFGFIFLSGILYEPPADFWELPATFRSANRLLEEEARGAGLGILPLESRMENWRAAVLRMKGLLEPHGIVFPALPEIGVDGATVAFDPEDIIPVF